jgi:hypothetical protein
MTAARIASELVSYQPARLDLRVLGALANPIREASGIERVSGPLRPALQGEGRLLTIAA